MDYLVKQNKDYFSYITVAITTQLGLFYYTYLTGKLMVKFNIICDKHKFPLEYKSKYKNNISLNLICKRKLHFKNKNK